MGTLWGALRGLFAAIALPCCCSLVPSCSFGMTFFRFRSASASPVKERDRPRSPRRLTLSDRYACPICRHGHIEALTLMEALACDFCRHIFTANLDTQVLRVEDSAQPLSWRWTGRSWQPVRHSRSEWTPALWFVAIALAIAPPGLIALGQYVFPPLPHSKGAAWFGPTWLGLAIVSHSVLVAWILLEHYQLPLYVSLKVRWQDFWMRYG